MAILRNYEGNPIIHDVCKEIVKVLPAGSNLNKELSIILESAGTVSGEYGFVEAYKKKVEEIKPWQQDESPRVQKFAQNYIASLKKQIEYEQKRADEGILLRKHQYGSGED
jgi:beta-lactamase class D